MGLAAAASLGSAPGVFDALAFLTGVKSGEITDVPGRVAVLGGGNTAVDAAVTAKRLGADDVYLIYRRSFLQMPAWEEDRQTLLRSGVQPLFLTQPLGYETAEGRLIGVRIARTELGPADSSGRRRPRTIPGSEGTLAVEMAIEAMGQDLPAAVGDALRGVGVEVGETVGTLPGTSATKVEGIFAGGDLVNGGETVVRAVADGMKAAEEIDAFLRR